MALIHSFEKSGNKLFRHRGQIPVILFLLAIPVVYFTNITGLNPLIIDITSLIAILISISGLYVRAYSIGTTPRGTSGRNTKEQVAESLNTGGIYSMIRHPLYLGNYLMWIGIVIFTFNIYFVLIVSLAYWLYYERIMFAEERFLERKFGEEYLNWSLTVPAFIPSTKNYKKSVISFSMISVLRREYSGFLACAFGYAFVDNLRYYFIHNDFDFTRISNYVFVISIIITLILRTLKHSNRLNEKGRS